MTLQDLYSRMGDLITLFLRKAHAAQGHTFTGTTERSFEFRARGTILSGYAVDYAKITDEGLEPNQISWKMLPGLIRYFSQKGLGEADAKKAAFFTIKKWMVEGMSTQNSKQYSSTGTRQGFIKEAFENSEIDREMSQGFDQLVEEQYRQVKSETI